jgi:hypothetical protein
MHVLATDVTSGTICASRDPVVASFQGDLIEFQRDKVRCPECLLRLDSPRFGIPRLA